MTVFAILCHFRRSQNAWKFGRGSVKDLRDLNNFVKLANPGCWSLGTDRLGKVGGSLGHVLQYLFH